MIASAVSICALSLQAAYAAHVPQACNAAAYGETLGESTPGSSGAPRLGTVGAPAVGHPFAFRIEDALAGGHGCLFVSTKQLVVPWPNFGAVSYVGAALVVIPFTVGADGNSPDLLPIAVSDSLCGSSLIAQAIVADPAATGGVAFTQAFRVGFGAPGDGALFEPPILAEVDEPVSAVRADLNLDGFDDLAVANAGADEVSVYLGGVGGSLVHFASFRSTGSSLRHLTTGDRNLDGIPDLVLTVSNGIEFLLGSGDGSFTPSEKLIGGWRWVGVGDLNGDGLNDLVALDTNSSLDVYLMQPDGTLDLHDEFPHGGSAHSAVMEDLDADGDLDIALTRLSFDDVRIFLGDGGGNFSGDSPIAVGQYPRHIAVGDLDDDGVRDLIVVNRDDQTVSILKGAGGGVFTVSGSIATDVNPEHGLLSDLDGDGRDEIVVANNSNPGGTNAENGSISVHWNDGVGGYSEERFDQLGHSPVLTVDADLDQNGALDLVTVGEAKATLLYAQGNGQFGVPDASPLDAGVSDLWSADMDRDGVPDLLYSGSGIEFRSGLGDGSFAPAVISDPGSDVSGFALGDVDGDNILDLAATAYQDRVEVYLGDGSGGFVLSADKKTGEDPRECALADFDNDGLLDLAVVSEEDLRTYRGKGDGTFAIGKVHELGPSHGHVSALEFSGDGFVDLVVANESQLCFLEGVGDGTFGAPEELLINSGIRGIELADLNEDGRLDIALPMFTHGEVGVLLSQATSGFEPLTKYPVGEGIGKLKLGDIDGGRSYGHRSLGHHGSVPLRPIRPGRRRLRYDLRRCGQAARLRYGARRLRRRRSS